MGDGEGLTNDRVRQFTDTAKGRCEDSWVTHFGRLICAEGTAFACVVSSQNRLENSDGHSILEPMVRSPAGRNGN